MVFAAANCALPVQRPCSTQKTSRGSGGAPAGTMRSLPMTRSCLPPLTSSPPRSNSGRLLRLINTRWLTEAPVLGCGSDNGENRDVLVSDGIKEPPIALGPRCGSRRRARRRVDECQAAKSGDTEKSADQGGENRTFHESLLFVNPDPVRANQRGYHSQLERRGGETLQGKWLLVVGF